jgi:small subunit ribosomal protein S11
MEKAEDLKETESEAQTEKQKRKSVGGIGIVHIYSTYNNTIIHITDLSGATITQISGGKTTKHSRLKATPTVAMFAAKRAAEAAKEVGIDSVYVRISSKAGSTSPGPGARAAVKSLSREGLKIINILETIAIPRGGPKAPGGKRGRRV